MVRKERRGPQKEKVPPSSPLIRTVTSTAGSFPRPKPPQATYGNFPNPNGKTFRAENGQDTWAGLCSTAKPRASPSVLNSKAKPSEPSSAPVRTQEPWNSQSTANEREASIFTTVTAGAPLSPVRNVRPRPALRPSRNRALHQTRETNRSPHSRILYQLIIHPNPTSSS